MSNTDICDEITNVLRRFKLGATVKDICSFVKKPNSDIATALKEMYTNGDIVKKASSVRRRNPNATNKRIEKWFLNEGK